MAKLYDMRKWKKLERSETEVTGYYNGHHVNVFLDSEDHEPTSFYAIVTAPNGSTCVDGWADDHIWFIDDAVRWALEGALLIEKAAA